MDYNSCPACSGKRSRSTDYGVSIRECTKCGAIFGNCYLGDSYAIVKPFFLKGEAVEEKYFDFTCLGSQGITRRHGWFDPASGYLTQIG